MTSNSPLHCYSTKQLTHVSVQALGRIGVNFIGELSQKTESQPPRERLF